MFDPRCLELAEHFLPTSVSDRMKMELAQHIQDEIESWIENERDKLLRSIQ